MNPEKQRNKLKEAWQAAYGATTREVAQKAIKKYEKALKKLAGAKEKDGSE